MSVNQNSLVGADHHRAVEVLKTAGNDVTMVIRRKKEVASSGDAAALLSGQQQEKIQNGGVSVSAGSGSGDAQKGEVSGW